MKDRGETEICKAVEREREREKGRREGEREREREREKERDRNYSSSHSRIYPKTERVAHCGMGTHRSYNVKLQLGQSVGWGGGGGGGD